MSAVDDHLGGRQDISAFLAITYAVSKRLVDEQVDVGTRLVDGAARIVEPVADGATRVGSCEDCARRGKGLVWSEDSAEAQGHTEGNPNREETKRSGPPECSGPHTYRMREPAGGIRFE